MELVFEGSLPQSPLKNEVARQGNRERRKERENESQEGRKVGRKGGKGRGRKGEGRKFRKKGQLSDLRQASDHCFPPAR